MHIQTENCLFPTKAFPTLVADAIGEIAAHKDVSEAMVAGAFLSLASMCIGRTRYILCGYDWREYANLYMLIIASSGSGKSHTCDYVFQHLDRINRRYRQAYEVEFRRYEQELQAYKKSRLPNKQKPIRPINTCHFIDADCSFEYLEKLMEENPRGLGWQCDNLYDLQFTHRRNDNIKKKKKLLDLWDSNAKHVQQEAFSMLIHSNPYLIRDFFTAEDVKLGLPECFLYVYGDCDKFKTLKHEEISKETDATVKLITDKLLSLSLDAPDDHLYLDPSAKEVFENFSNAMLLSTPDQFRGFAAKMSRMTLRFALILHLMDWASQNTDAPHSVTITSATMQRATLLSAWFLEQTKHPRKFLPGKQTKALPEKVAATAKKLAGIIDGMTETERKTLRSMSEIQTWFPDVCQSHIGKALASLHIFSTQSRKGRRYCLHDMQDEYMQDTSF